MTSTEALEIERHAERVDEPDAWLVAGDAWEEAGDAARAWYARLRGSGRVIRRAEAEYTRAANKAYNDARRAFDPRRYERGGGYSDADEAAILRIAGLERRPTNAELGRLEVFDFVTDPPERLFGYYDDAGAIRTFAGDLLGTIIHRGATRHIRGNFQHVSVRGENGFAYHGTCNLETGNYCRLQRGRSWIGLRR